MSVWPDCARRLQCPKCLMMSRPQIVEPRDFDIKVGLS